jgi:bifunctional NMN adenylyltransferase/nudix hydrolase
LIKRKNHPGRGLWALPGGYFDLKDGSLLEGCYRELKEETGLNVSLEEFKSMVVKTDIFDHPKRSLVARLITYLCVVKLNNNHMSQIEASDDASSAEWFDLSTVTGMANIMYDDHWHIIDKMIRLK